jgi:hypothetical protein
MPGQVWNLYNNLLGDIFHSKKILLRVSTDTSYLLLKFLTVYIFWHWDLIPWMSFFVQYLGQNTVTHKITIQASF